MSKRQHNSAPPGRPDAQRRDGVQPYRRAVQRPDAETVVFPAPLKIRPETIDGFDPGHFPAPDAEAGSQPGGRARVVLRARGRHGAGPVRYNTSTSRRTWVSRAVLLAILGVQAALTLRMQNTAFEDEALYLSTGHMEIAHWLHGAALQGDYPSYFSGAPVLYPVLGAAADSLGGLAAARAVSLLAMLATTGLLYSLTRRLFNERVGLCAAVCFSVTESALFLGNLATYDATALFLLAIASWIIVRTAAFRWPVYLLAAPVVVLTVATKYASLLYVPTVVALTALAAGPHRGRKALIPPAAFAAAVAALLIGAVHLAGPDYLKGIEFSTTARAGGTTPTTVLLRDCLIWGGLPFVLAAFGAFAYAIRPHNEPGELIAPPGGRFRRIALGVVLAGTALLAPAEQIRLHTETSLQKHIGFGLFFAAPLVGAGLARIVGDHFRRAQVGIAIWGAALALGMAQAYDLFTGWPNSTVFVREMARYLQPGAHYLVEVDEVPVYYLRGYPDARPDQFTSTYYIGYVGTDGQFRTGAAGYQAAIKAGYFRVIAYTGQVTRPVDSLLARTLEADPSYRLAAAIPNRGDNGTYYIWVKRQ
ncbi:MAG TPA: glycosyltransferase family 39 protein [Streptosporangiaceae bacterium]|nr:glycosyltransferase family 39 protein [Streptosporangiaceae bacterium]